MFTYWNKRVFFRVVSLIVVAAFAFNNIATASMVSATTSMLRPTAKKALDGGKELGNELAFLNENSKTIAEATSANIGKFLAGGVISQEFVAVANTELQKLVTAGLLTGYRVTVDGQKLVVLTIRQNQKAVTDSAKVPTEILNVFLTVLAEAQNKNLYNGEDLRKKSYGQQWSELEVSAPAPSLTYSKANDWANMFFGNVKTELKVPEGQAATFFTNDYDTFTISELFAKPVEQIPNAVVDAVRKKLNQDVASGKLLGAIVNDFGGTDIDIQVTHKYGELNAAVQKLILEAMKEGVLKAKELGLLRKNVNLASMSLVDLAKAQRPKWATHSINERGAEPVIMVKIIGAGIGASNIKLYHEFFMPGSTPLKKLGFVPEVGEKDKPGVRGFRAVVRRTEDVLSGNKNGLVWEFEVSSAFKKGDKQYSSKDESLELLALASQPNDFLITAIYAVEGSTIPSTEPVVSVAYQPVYGEKGGLRTLNPTFICRSQSGADAVAGVASMFYDVNFVPGGENGEHYVATKPVTLKEARKAPKEGTANVVVYGWQSKGNGVIPREVDGVIDHVAINPPALGYERQLADWLASVMSTHKNDQPYIAPFATQEKVEPLREAQSHLFTRAPKEADIDPFMDEVEAKVASGDFLAVIDDKADMGGKIGHNFTPEYMLAIDRATIIEAIENGELSDGNIIGFTDKNRLKEGTTVAIGDDSHLLMLGDKKRNGAAVHQLAFLAFTRGYYGAVINGEKPYGLAQDYQGKEAKAAKANPVFYSHFTPRFFEILRTIMPMDYMGMVDKMEAGWKEKEKTQQETTVLTEPFSGNVSQQGIGSAAYRVDVASGERTFGILAGDKMGPAALNRPIREGVYSALKAGEFKNGLVFEVWDAKAFDNEGNIALNKLPELFADVADAITSLKEAADQDFVKKSYAEGKLRSDLQDAEKIRLVKLLKQAGYVPTERIFLDAQKDKEAIFTYFADSDRFNIKQVWDKRSAGWDINNPQVYLNRPILGSSVTKLGILAGGEYIGKDDPVMVGNIKLMEHIYLFLRGNPLIIQGDMNGSHWLAAIPTAFKYAVANKESHPILVGLRYTLSEDGKQLAKVEDVFGNKAYRGMRNKLFKFNFEFKRAQLGGQFEPYGTNERTVEASYPLAKLLRALQAPNSPFLVKNKPQAERAARPIGVVEQVADLFNAATGSLTTPFAPAGWTGVNESSRRFYSSLLRLQSEGVSVQPSEDAYKTAKDNANKKAMLIHSSVLRKDPSIILTAMGFNEQVNQRSGVFGSSANTAANAFKPYLIVDEPGLQTMQDVEKLFAEIAKVTNNGIVVNKDTFAGIITQKDMVEGKISNAADLIKQLDQLGVASKTISAVIGPTDWISAIKKQSAIPADAISVVVETKENEIAFAGNAYLGAIEAISSPNRQLSPLLAAKLDLTIQDMTSMQVDAKPVNQRVEDTFEVYRETINKV